MNNSSPQDLSQLTSRQLADLAWELKGTPEVQPIYWEISRRPTKSSIELDDPEWDAKITALILSKQSQPTP
ncbi:MAG: hypothetical protein KME35_21750 [Aphanocapsa sp. GSE-SYN-MK-11-07L]|nr:hypothetical protein [Aphanocapsa sp. GSE-SYN-MK-11-07L]